MKLNEYIDILTVCINSSKCEHVDKMVRIRKWLIELKNLRAKIKEIRSDV